MKILLEPNFMFENGNYEGYVGINSMLEENQIKLNRQIISYLKKIFTGEERNIKRVGETNYYSVDVLSREVDDIKVWYNIHLMNAITRGLDENQEWMIQLNQDVAYAPEDGQPFEAGEMTIRTNAGEILIPGLDFYTAEGRADAMGYVNIDNNLYGVDIENLYAKDTFFMGLSFDDSKLNDSVFKEAYLPMTKFNRCKLRKADFRYADLMYAEFQQADLTGANFEDANLTGVIFKDAILTGTNFKGAILTGADFSNSNWEEAINLRDNPTFSNGTPPIQRRAIPVESLPVSQIAINIALPTVLKKLVKPQQKGNMLKDDVWQDENEFNVIDAKNPKKMKHCDEKWTSRNRMIVSKAEYEMLPAEYADIDPTLVSIENEEIDKGNTLGEDLLLEEDEDEKVPLKNFFAEQPDGFLFRVVQGEKFDDILISNAIYKPTTSDYLRKATDLNVNATDLQKKAKNLDLIVYTCEAGRMGTANKKRPLIDIGKVIGMATQRIYVDLNEFKNIVLADIRNYKCYILYKHTNQSEKYQSLTSHNVLFNPGMNVVSELHCNKDDEGSMSGLIWSIKPIGDNLMQGGKRRKQKNTRKKSRTIRYNKTKKYIKISTIKKDNKNNKKNRKKRTIKKNKKYSKV